VGRHAIAVDHDGGAVGGGALWLGMAFALPWFVALTVLTRLDRLLCWRLCRRAAERPSRRRAVEIVIAFDILFYTLAYCVLPLALVARNEHLSIIAGMVAMGAIVVSGASEFIVSRLVGAPAILALIMMAVVCVLWGARLREWPQIAFALFEVFGSLATCWTWASAATEPHRRSRSPRPRGPRPPTPPRAPSWRP
jgi:hypothetical protein